MTNDFNATTVLYDSEETARRSGPTWPVFVLVIAMVLIAGGLGFYALYGCADLLRVAGAAAGPASMGAK